MTVTLLGTGDAFASFGRSQSGYLIDAPGGRILMEAGPGLMQALKGGGVSTDSFDLLLISHLHGDHFGGLPFLILDYMWETRRKKALTIAGPAKLEERTWTLMRTMFPHFELDKIKHKLKFVVLEPEQLDARSASSRLARFAARTPSPTSRCRSRSTAAASRSCSPATADGTTSWCSSPTAPTCSCANAPTSRARQLKFHLNYPQLEANRDKFNVRRMVLTHLGREVLSREPEIAHRNGLSTG